MLCRTRVAESRRLKVRLDPEAVIELVRPLPGPENRPWPWGATFPNCDYDAPPELQVGAPHGHTQHQQRLCLSMPGAVFPLMHVGHALASHELLHPATMLY